MKNTFALFAVAGLTAYGFSSFTFQQNEQQDQPKKTRHIKITKIDNGSKMELDTTLSGNDVFVWKGDTINPDKDSKKFSPSEFDKIHNPDGDKNGLKKVRIYQYGGDKSGDSARWKSDPDNDVEIFSEEAGDSAQKKIIIHKRLKDGTSDDRFIYFNGPNGENFPPMPPMPPMPHINLMRHNNAEGIIDLNDPNIISFKKKKMSGDREKIEIIRKKSKPSENMDFNFQMDDAMVVPEPPEPPVFENEINNDESVNKEIRKEIRVEVKKDSIQDKDLSPKQNK